MLNPRHYLYGHIFLQLLKAVVKHVNNPWSPRETKGNTVFSLENCEKKIPECLSGLLTFRKCSRVIFLVDEEKLLI